MKINFIDVGCAGYMPSPWRINEYGKYINYVLGFDGFSDELNYLDKEFSNNIVYNSIIFDDEKELLFNICKRSRVSSLFKPNREVLKSYIKYINTIRYPKIYHINKYDIEENRKVKCVRLDTILKKHDINFDFIKIDTEGADYNVIKSLGKYLDTQIVGIHTELYFKEMYKGITLFEDVDSFLKEHGFYLAKKMNGVEDFWANFLYIRKHKSKKNKIKLIKKAYEVRI